MGYNFQKAAGVKLSERGQYLTPARGPSPGLDAQTGKPIPGAEIPGQYVLKIKRNIVKHSRTNKDLWIAECTIVESNNPEHPVGADRNWVQDLSDPQVGFRSVKGFLYATMGLDTKNAEHKKLIDECEAEEEEVVIDGVKRTVKKDPRIVTMMNGAVEDPSDPACKNSLKDALVRVEVKTIKTKEKKQDFSLHIFSPYVAPQAATAA